MDALTVLLIMKLDTLACIFKIIGALSVAGIFFGYVMPAIDDDFRLNNIFPKLRERCVGVCIIVLLLGLTVPDTKQAAGMYIIPKIMKNENIRDIPEELGKLLKSVNILISGDKEND